MTSSLCAYGSSGERPLTTWRRAVYTVACVTAWHHGIVRDFRWRGQPPWRNGIRGRLRACARKGVVVRVHSGAPEQHDQREQEGGVRSRDACARRFFCASCRRIRAYQRAASSAAEHLVYTQRVTGSNPVPPTNFPCSPYSPPHRAFVRNPAQLVSHFSDKARLYCVLTTTMLY